MAEGEDEGSELKNASSSTACVIPNCSSMASLHCRRLIHDRDDDEEEEEEADDVEDGEGVSIGSSDSTVNMGLLEVPTLMSLWLKTEEDEEEDEEGSAGPAQPHRGMLLSVGAVDVDDASDEARADRDKEEDESDALAASCVRWRTRSARCVRHASEGSHSIIGATTEANCDCDCEGLRELPSDGGVDVDVDVDADDDGADGDREGSNEEGGGGGGGSDRPGACVADIRGDVERPCATATARGIVIGIVIGIGIVDEVAEAEDGGAEEGSTVETMPCCKGAATVGI